MTRDPVCGMNVKKDDRNKGFRSEYNGQDYHFCSDKCRREFDRNPDNYIRRDHEDRDNQPRNEDQLGKSPRDGGRDRE